LAEDQSVHTNRGYLAAFGATLFLATTAIFIRYLSVNFQIPALVLTFWRELFTAGAICLVLLAIKPEFLWVDQKDIVFLVAYGFVLAMFNSMWALSVALNGASTATVLVYSSAAFTAVLGWLILKEELGWAKIVAVLLSIAGIALVVNVLDRTAWLLTPSGFAAGLLAGLSYAGYSLMGRAASQRGVNAWTSLFYIFSFASILMLAVNLSIGRFLPGGAGVPADMFWLGRQWVGWLVLLILAVVPTLLGFGLYNVSLQYLPSSVANLVLTVEPVITATIAYFVFGEILTGIQILGSGLILCGVFLLRLTK
jgi:drug/metabolite transporter (DMT)-like permease